MSKPNPFKYYKTSPEIIKLLVMIYVRFPLSLRQIEDMLHLHGIDISHESVRYWWNKFGPPFTAEIWKKRARQFRNIPQWHWHLDKVFVKINGEPHYLWRAVDHEGEVLESFVTKRRDKEAALKFLKKAMKNRGRLLEIVTDRLRSYSATMKEISNSDRQFTAGWANNRAENLHLHFRRRERAVSKFRLMSSLQKFVSIHAQFPTSSIIYAIWNQEKLLRNTATNLLQIGIVFWQVRSNTTRQTKTLSN